MSPAAQTIAPVQAAVPVAPGAAAPVAGAAVGAEPEKKSHKVLWLVIILVILILLGAGWWFLF